MKESLLPEPPASDPNRQKLKVFLLGTPDYITIIISKVNKVEDAIRHIMAVYNTSPRAKDAPLDHPDDTAAYELRLLEDDEEEYFTPLYEIAALDKKKKIGEFDVDAVAFCKVKQYNEKAVLPIHETEDDIKYKQLEKIASIQNVH